MANVSNRTGGVAELVPLIDKDGHGVGVVILKLTYEFKGGVLEIAEQQESIRFVDEYFGEPGKSDLRVPSDLSDKKPATDVLLIFPARGVPSGSSRSRGFAAEVGPVRVSGDLSTPWRFGPVGRDDKRRLRYAGTYDQDWLENRMPLVPVDFDLRYHQAAPTDQIVPGYLKGDEMLRFSNLRGDGQTAQARLPGRACVLSGNVLSHYFTEVPPLDTVSVFVETLRVTLVWRYAIRVRQKIEEISNIHIFMASTRITRELYGKP
jgi:hypothetical protein